MIGSRKLPLLFIVLTLSWCLAGAVPLIWWSQASIHLIINSYHTVAADFIFRWITNLGDGWSVVPMVIVLAVYSSKDAVTMASANIVTGFTTQLLKKTIFSGVVRPSKFFKGIAVLHTIPGVQLYSYESFPSGHAATVFTVCTLLALRTTKPAYHIILFLIAVVTAFSRVYLSQHFLQDVAAGSLIGLVIGIGIDAGVTGAAAKRPLEHWLNKSVL